MSEQILIEALNDSLDRLASGQTIDDCLRAHPDVADDLRILLETGQTTRRARADRAELDGMRSRLDTHFDALLEETQFRKPIFVIPQGAAVLLVASILLVLVGFFILFPREESPVADDLTHTATHTPEITQDPNFTPIPTVTLSETPTETLTPTLTETVTPTMTATATTTASPTSSVTATETPSPTATSSSTNTPVPEPTPCVVIRPEDWQIYQVQSGDTLSSIAAQSGTTINNLMQVNCLETTTIIQSQTIYIPPIVQTTSGSSATQATSSSGGDKSPTSASSSSDSDERDDSDDKSDESDESDDKSDDSDHSDDESDESDDESDDSDHSDDD